MITQHVVSYGGDVTLTRLPAGRAEGFIWLSFVARGIEVPGAWRIGDHIKLTWLDGSAAEVTDGGAAGDDEPHQFHVTIRDAGYNTLTISYVEGEQVINTENVALPSDPDPDPPRVS